MEHKHTIRKTKKRQNEPIWRWLITFISIFLFIYIIYKAGWNEFFQIINNADISMLVFGIILLFVSRIFVSFRWYVLLKVAKNDLLFGNSVKITYAGLFASNFLPSSIGGDLVRYIGSVQAGIDSALVLASLIMDRVVGFAGMVLLIPSGISLLSNRFTSQTIKPEILNSISFPVFSSFFNSIFKKIIEFTKKLIEDLIFWIKYPKNLLLSFFFTLLHETFLFGMIWFFLRAISENVSFGVIASLYSLSYLVTLIPLSIGGLGIQEMSITYLFSHFGGVSVQGAIVLATLSRMAYLLNSLPGAFFLPSILRQNSKERTG